jgi:integrase
MKIDIRFRNQPSNTSSQPVYLRLNHYNSKLFKNQKRIWFKTNYNLKIGDDINKSLNREVRHHLESCIEFVENDFYNRVDFIPTTKWFANTCRQFLNSEKRIGYLLSDEISKYIDKQVKLKKAYNTIKDNKQSQKIINDFKSDIELADCNYNLFEQFRDYLMFTKEYAVSNSNRKIRFLRTVLKEAKKKYPKEVPDDFRDLEPLRETKAVSTEKENIYKVTFTEKELDTIANLELTKESLINARKWLIIGVHTAIRGQDILNLKLSDFDIVKKVLKIQQQKTKSFAEIPILPPVEEVIKAFPHKISLQKFNDYIKKICKLAGMTNLVTSEKQIQTPKGKRYRIVEDEKYTFCASHMFRRSFITKYYLKLPNEEIMRVTGHKSEREFLGYVQEVKTNHQIWFDLYNNRM